MSRIGSLAGCSRLIGLAVVLGPLLCGCSSDRMIRPQRDGSTVVQRPTYEVPGEKTLYLGGYAGVSYDPADMPGR
jgi:hypothetical protein